MPSFLVREQVVADRETAHNARGSVGLRTAKEKSTQSKSLKDLARSGASTLAQQDELSFKSFERKKNGMKLKSDAHVTVAHSRRTVTPSCSFHSRSCGQLDDTVMKKADPDEDDDEEAATVLEFTAELIGVLTQWRIPWTSRAGLWAKVLSCPWSVGEPTETA